MSIILEDPSSEVSQKMATPGKFLSWSQRKNNI